VMRAVQVKRREKIKGGRAVVSMAFLRGKEISSSGNPPLKG